MRIYLFLVPVFLFSIILSTSCNPYAKLAKSRNIADKDSAAVHFFKKKRYEQSVYLLEELLGVYRGTPRAKEIYYYFAYSKYHIGELVSAAYYFSDFARQYPRDEKLVEMQYMSAYCYFQLAEPWYLDPKYTYKAMEQMQVFIDLYPDSDYHDKCEEVIRDLRERLARKSFEQAKLYYRIGYFKAAVKSLDLLILEFPDSQYREEAQYLLFKSCVSLAGVSIPARKVERYEESFGYYEKFVDRFPQSKWIREAENTFSNAQKNHQKLAGLEEMP